MMKLASTLCAITICLVGLPRTIALSYTVEYYELYNILEESLTSVSNQSNDTVSNLKKLSETFFPKRSSEPMCVGVEYVFTNNELTECTTDNSSFLWTKSQVGASVATLLLAYHRGIGLKGFEWDRSCLVDSKMEMRLEIPEGTACNGSLLEECLADLTTQLKGFAASQAIPSVDNSYRAYAINWNNSELGFAAYDAVFTSQVVVLSLFIFLFSLSASNYLYDKLFQNIYDTKNKHSISPAYPLYWSIVVVSVLWNIAPSWIIIYHSNKVLYAILVLAPLLLLVAVGVRKKTEFPIPFFRMMGCIFHVRDSHSYVCHLCVRCIARHAVQVCSIWSLLVTFAFLVHYLCAIILAFYLDPLGTLAKLLFIKAVALSVILNVALLFTINRPTYKCNRSALMKNAKILIGSLTVLSFLPILGYLMYVIGQVVFMNDYGGNSWQSVLTIIPPLILAVTSWYSQGLLFPDGVKDPTHPIKEIERDLEGNNSHSDSGHGGGSAKVTMDGTPLLPHGGGRQSLNQTAAAAADAGGQNAGGGVSQRSYNSISLSLSESGGKLA